MAFTKHVRGYHPAEHFNANGLLSEATLGVVGTFTLAAVLDGLRHVDVNLRIDVVRFTQLVDGSAGSTTVELYRRRAGVNTLLATVTIAFGGGNYSTKTVVPASEALRELQIGDLLIAQFTSAQEGASDGTLQVSFT